MKRSLSKQFGKSIRRLREEIGLTQVVLGEQCGFHQTYLSRIESGQANPTVNAMEVLANAFGLSIYELCEEVQRTL
ncbi:MAG: XRE family transcriptional regulator [Verrucomicrobiaceae bacterium]|nr:MAG: XRE family transcriptional regulator [Verrucomicrobiaceae bacterium]